MLNCENFIFALKMSVITNQLIYDEILQSCLRFQKCKYCINNLGFLSRSTHVKAENEIKSFTVFVPNYMKKFLNSKQKQMFQNVQKHYMSSQKSFQYSKYIVVPYVYLQSTQYLNQALYYVFIQGYFKQLPIIILKDSISQDGLSLLKREFQDEINEDQYNNYVILPNSLYLKTIVFDKQLSQNSNIVLTDKHYQHYYPVICDRQNEMEINALHQAQIFLDDPTWTALIADQSIRLEVQKFQCMNIQKGTYQYGLNFLFVQNLNLMNSKCCLLTCPPGVTKGHTGSFLGGVKLIIKYLGIQNIPLGTVLDQMHSGGCLQKANHYYVGYIGCALEENSNGCGTAMFKLMHSIANQSRANMYLENSKVQNIEFYKKMGLRLYQRYDILNKFGYKAHTFIMNSDPDKPCQILSADQIDPTDWEEMDVDQLLQVK